MVIATGSKQQVQISTTQLLINNEWAIAVILFSQREVIKKLCL